MRFEVLTAQLFREMRGKRSQSALSRRLGYAANMAYVWESQRRTPPVSSLFRLAALNQRDLRGLAQFGFRALSAQDATRWSPTRTAGLVSALTGELPMVAVAKVARVDRTTVARWLRGVTEPNVTELLRLVDGLTHRLVEFVGLFVDPRGLPVLARLAENLEMQRRLVYERPWTHGILRALELERYRNLDKHEEGVLARSIGVTVEDERQLLQALASAGLVRFRLGKWHSVRTMTVDTRVDAKSDQRVKEHWAGIGLERLQKAPLERQAFYSYNLCAVSEPDFQRIRELHLEYFERVRRIVADSRDAHRVLLVNQQLIPLDE